MILRILVVSLALLNASDAGAVGLAGRAQWRGGIGLKALPPPSVHLPPPVAGAVFPVNFDLSAFDASVGTLRYVSTTGSDAADCSSALTPCLTLAYAVNAATAGDGIVIRGGLYRGTNMSGTSPPSGGAVQGGTGSLAKSLYITNYPGEVPEFRGSIDVTSAFHPGTAEGGYRYITYVPQPVTSSGYANVPAGQNIIGGVNGVGRFSDQMWIGSTALQQVNTKAELVSGKFWIDVSNRRAYLVAADAALSAIEISDRTNFLTVNITAPNTTIRGFKVNRYSPSAADYAIMDINQADGFKCDNVEFSDITTAAINLNGTNADQQDNTTIYYCSFLRHQWFEITGSYNYHTLLEGVKSNDGDPWNEFNGSPGSGIKFTHCKDVKVESSEIRNNKSHGLWFDQECYDVVIGANQITGNLQTGVFFEISDKLLLINNWIQSTGDHAAKLGGGSTGLRVIQNTIVGGPGVLGVYTDRRSYPGCADQTVSPNPSSLWTYCSGTLGSLTSDRVPPPLYVATNDWMPRIDEMWNNIIAWPTSGDPICTGKAVAFCVSDNNTQGGVSTQVPGGAGSIIHHADVPRGIPQTYMDYNVYASPGSIVGLPNPATGDNSTLTYKTVAEYAAALAASPYSLPLETHSWSTTGLVAPDGQPSDVLKGLENTAKVVPTDAELNVYLPAGTQCYGVAYLCGS